MPDFDTPWKDILDLWFERFVAFFFPQMHAEINWARGYEFLDKELQKIAPRVKAGSRLYVDKLVKVWHTNDHEEWLLIHIEVQGRKEKNFGRRMYDYNTRLFARYNRTVVSVAVLTDEQADWRPRGFGYDLWGCKVAFEFPVVKLLDYTEREAELEAHPNPFAVVVLAHLKALETRGKSRARHSWKIRLVRGLFDRGLTAEQIRQLFRFIDWVIELPRDLEAAFWEEIEEIREEKHMPQLYGFERRGMELGLKQGREEGLTKGLKQGTLKAIRIGLKLRFGRKGLKLLTQIRAIEGLEKLDELCKLIEDAESLEEIQAMIADKE